MKEPRFSYQVKTEFYYLLSFANIYPLLHTKGWIAASILNYMVVLSWNASGIVMLGYTSFLIKDRISFLSQALHMLIGGAITFIACVYMSSNRKQFEKFEKLFCEPESFAPYAKSEYFQNLSKAEHKKKDRLFVFWFCMYGTCGLIGILQSTIDSLAGVGGDVQNVNGVWINLPFVMWFPGDLENDVTMWLVAYGYEVVFLTFLALQVTTDLVLCFYVSGKILDQLKLNVWAVENLGSRAKRMFSQRYPQRKVKDMKEEYDVCYYDCIVENVKHHYMIKREFDSFKGMISIAMAVPFYGAAILLGMALITITAEDDPRVGPKYMAAMMLIAEGMSLYSMCKVGQDFQDLSLEISDALFYTKWYKRSKKCAKAIIIMRYGASRPLKLVAGLITLHVGLFADLVNSAYSIFNFKAASKE